MVLRDAVPKKKDNVLLCKKNSASSRALEVIPKELHEFARRSLTKLFRDSLTLNDNLQYEYKEQKDAVEDEIVDDFQNVAEYIQYLELRLEQNGIIFED